MSPDPASEGTDDTRPGVERLLALSDGVVAIAITLLVLELKVPSTEPVRNSDSAAVLATQLGKGGDQWAAYLISFYVVAQFWLAHYPDVPPDHRGAGGAGLVELRVPVHHQRDAVYQRPAGQLLR